MAKEGDRKKGGGKLSKKRREGLALSEFIDSAGVNNRETGVGEAPPLAEVKKAGALGRAVEKALANPTLVIVGLAAIPLLFLAWGFMRRKKDRDQEPKEDES